MALADNDLHQWTIRQSWNHPISRVLNKPFNALSPRTTQTNSSPANPALRPRLVWASSAGTQSRAGGGRAARPGAQGQASRFRSLALWALLV